MVEAVLLLSVGGLLWFHGLLDYVKKELENSKGKDVSVEIEQPENDRVLVLPMWTGLTLWFGHFLMGMIKVATTIFETSFKEMK
jgi:hypothetical protein